jgi:hypothetical protein
MIRPHDDRRKAPRVAPRAWSDAHRCTKVGGSVTFTFNPASTDLFGRSMKMAAPTSSVLVAFPFR